MLLRPEFTQKLAAELAAGNSINLISPHGQGRRRTLQDLTSLLSSSLEVIQLDLRRQPFAVEQTVATFLKREKPGLLIIHNFDRLQNQSVIAQLKAIQTHTQFSLLTVSETAENLSALHIRQLKLPAINKIQLLQEVTRRKLDNTLSATEIAEWLLQQQSPYSLLDELQPLDLVRRCREAGQAIKKKTVQRAE